MMAITSIIVTSDETWPSGLRIVTFSATDSTGAIHRSGPVTADASTDLEQLASKVSANMEANLASLEIGELLDG